MIELKKSIGYRLLRHVFGWYFAIAAVVTITQLGFEYGKEKDRVFFELANLGETLDDSISIALWNYDLEQVSATLIGIDKVSTVAGTRVTTDENEFVASSGEEFLSASVTQGPQFQGEFGQGRITKTAQNSGEQSQTVFEYQVPIHYVEIDQGIDKVVGYFYLYTGHDVIVERVKAGFIVILVNSLIKTTALWFIFLFFTKRILAKPLNDLTKAARGLDPTDPSSLAEGGAQLCMSHSNSGDELQVLANNFIHMSNAIRDKMAIIEGQNQGLENRAEQQTASLSKANEHLSNEIEQRKTAESGLRIYQKIIENSDEAIFVADRSGVINQANPACERVTGLSHEQLIGKEIEALVFGEIDSPANQEMQDSIRASGHWHGETLRVHANGERVPLWVVVSAVYNQNRNVDYLIYVCRDLSDQKESKELIAELLGHAQ